MAKLIIKNPSFKLIKSIDKNFKEVEVIFTYKGEKYKYFIFIENDRKGNPIKEAKKQFNIELKSGKVAKTLQLGTNPWAITAVGVFGVTAIVFGALFINQAIKTNKPEYIVSFVSNGGTHVAPIKVKGGETISPPKAPTKDEYAFDGWFKDPEFTGEEYTFNDPINDNVTLWAKWGDISDHVLLTFNAGENNIVEGTTDKQVVKQYFKKGTRFINVFKNMGCAGGAKENEDFLYWAIDGNRVTEDYEITESKELTAVYKPIMEDCITFTTRIDNSSINFNTSIVDLQFSTDGFTWSNVTSDPVELETAGSQVYIRRNPESTQTAAINEPLTTGYSGKYSVSGALDSLYPLGVPAARAFMACFRYDSSIVSAKNIDLGDVITSYHCAFMFQRCTSLICAPDLPSNDIDARCYLNMFQGCTSLTIAPDLPAEQLYNYCYQYMFQGCASLTTAPTISATSLANYCYSYMFKDCISLTTAPALPAETLTQYCYEYMFQNCTSLVNAPILPAEELAPYCYQYMFYGCTSLTTAPTISATTLGTRCYYYMFSNCTSLTTAPDLPVLSLAPGCYERMFQFCTSLTTAPALPAETLTQACYQYMFAYCSSLIKAPKLPTKTFQNSWYSCYANMFFSCTSLRISEDEPNDGTIVCDFNDAIGLTTAHVSGMFNSTGGSFTGVPTQGHIYYCY